MKIGRMTVSLTKKIKRKDLLQDLTKKQTNDVRYLVEKTGRNHELILQNTARTKKIEDTMKIMTKVLDRLTKK